MKVHIRQGFNEPLIQEATSLLITDDFDNPIAFIISYNKANDNSAEHIRICHALEPDFEDQLKLHGVNCVKVLKV